MIHELLHPYEVARRLGLHRYTVYLMLRRQRLLGYKQRGRWWVPSDEVAKHLERQKEKTA